MVPHQLRPPENDVFCITVDNAGFVSMQELDFYIRTVYKRKDRKVNPVNIPLPDGVNPGGGMNLSKTGPYLDQRSGVIVPRGSRLTPERLAKMRIGGKNLTEPE